MEGCCSFVSSENFFLWGSYSFSSENSLCEDNSYCSRPGGQSQEEEEDSQIPFGPSADLQLCQSSARYTLSYKNLMTIPSRSPLLSCIEKKKTRNAATYKLQTRGNSATPAYFYRLFIPTISSRWRDKIFMHSTITVLIEKNVRGKRAALPNDSRAYYFFRLWIVQVPRLGLTITLQVARPSIFVFPSALTNSHTMIKFRKCTVHVLPAF